MAIIDLKSFRRDLKLKQSDLQDILGITQGYLSRIETGKEFLPERHYEKLKEKYGEEVLLKYIIGEKQNDSIFQSIVGNSNISTIGNNSGGVDLVSNKDLMDRIIALEKEIIKLNGELATKDATIEGLKNELTIRLEMITILQNKK